MAKGPIQARKKKARKASKEEFKNRFQKYQTEGRYEKKPTKRKKREDENSFR